MTATTAPTLTTQAAAAHRVRHAPECTGPDYRPTTGRRGDQMVRCRGCGRSAPITPHRTQTPATTAASAGTDPTPTGAPPAAILDAHDRPQPRHTPDTHPEGATPDANQRVGTFSAPSQPAVPPIGSRATSRYRCATHDHPVTWRGTGCPDCARERDDREARATRANRRD